MTNEPNESDSENAQTNRSDSSAEFELYNGRKLKIAVIGSSPKVREDQVEFNEISFDELKNNEMNTYDAVFIMKEKLSQAAESQYADIYSSSTIPFFFITAKSHIPFTLKDTEYSKSWEWTPGNMYTSSVMNNSENNSLNGWGVSLYNDEKTEAHITSMYSFIFKKIEEVGLEE
ncbi:hypothetical protein GLW20_01860 [Virgibacillus halodenitrificans]|nr:hypothetical protein [Virgibacillus halodenitrificans]